MPALRIGPDKSRLLNEASLPAIGNRRTRAGRANRKKHARASRRITRIEGITRIDVLALVPFPPSRLLADQHRRVRIFVLPSHLPAKMGDGRFFVFFLLLGLRSGKVGGAARRWPRAHWGHEVCRRRVPQRKALTEPDQAP